MPEPEILPSIEMQFDTVELAPETPAGLDLFSPVSTEPSAVQHVLRDTPPPPDLKCSVPAADSRGSFGRTSRRAKGAVNYAEPNLRDKMRRPTKELADAVMVGEGLGRASSARAEDRDATKDQNPKLEVEQGKNLDPRMEDVSTPSALQSLPEHELHDSTVSPLRSKSSGPGTDLSSSMMERKARVAAIFKGSEARGDGADSEQTMGRSDIYDGPSSSPLHAGGSQSKKDLPGSKLSRRHSTISGTTNRTGDHGAAKHDSITVSRSVPVSKVEHPPRRREYSRESDKEGGASKGGKRVQTSEDLSGIGRRPDRAAVRRRSMML